jgi:hypothetical protein
MRRAAQRGGGRIAGQTGRTESRIGRVKAAHLKQRNINYKQKSGIRLFLAGKNYGA